jgi:cold shock CspA family protein
VWPQHASAAGLKRLDEGQKVTVKPVNNEGGKVAATNIKLGTPAGNDFKIG